jgi:subtilisin family serine protease
MVHVSELLLWEPSPVKGSGLDTATEGRMWMSPNPEATRPTSRHRLLLIVSMLLIPTILIAQREVGSISYAATPLPPVRAADFDMKLADLLTEVAATGQVRIIVNLAVPTQFESELATMDEVDSQRRAITLAQDAVRTRLASLPVTIHRAYSVIPAMAMSVDADGLQALAAAPEVVSIERDKLSTPLMDQSNPLIEAPAAWASGYTGSGQAVAVLDTGVDKSHPFLSGQVIAEACFSTTSDQYSSASLCPGGDASSTAPGSGVHCTGTNGCSHGTHVAGTIAGKSTVTRFNNASVTLSGVAPGAKIIAIQVFSTFFTDRECGFGTYDSRIWGTKFRRGCATLAA